MSFDDKKFGTIFPVRDGLATGTANERQMLDAIGGSDSFRTRIQKNDDGSETMLRTKNGMPQFSTVLPQVELKSAPLYMESGQLGFTFPGPENPSRADAATWKMLDIQPSSAYLGAIAPEEQIPGLPANTTALHDGQDSLAIGPPTAAKKETYRDITVSKKLIAAMFPSSLFTGKMRLFLQAQYGAKESLDTTTGLIIDVLGAQALLKYAYAGKTIQFGLWPHLSVGLFTAQDGTFWLLQIMNGEANKFTVHAYPIEILKRAKRLYDIYKSGAYSVGDKSKIEAYLFAHSRINLNTQLVIGGFEGSDGEALAYGWHFNTSGNEASIVVHERNGVGVSHGVSLFAKTMKVSIAYASGSFQINASATDGGEWTDGWGAYNLFVPEEDLGTRLISYSVAMDTTWVKAPFSFSGVPIYGFYKDDVWTAVSMSRNLVPGGLGYSQSSTGLQYATYDENTPNRFEFSSRSSVGGYTYNSKNLTDRYTMDISVGSFVLNGESERGDFVTVVGTASVTGEWWQDILEAREARLSATANDGTVSSGWPASQAAYLRGEFLNSGAVSKYVCAAYTEEHWAYTAWRHRSWSVVIPGFDSEAVYVAKRTILNTTSNSIHVYYSTPKGPAIEHDYGKDYSTPGYPPTEYVWDGFHSARSGLGDIFQSPAVPDYSDTSLPTFFDESVFCWNSALSGAAGSQGGSYYALFTVDKTYPFYDRGMYMRTSAGDRYVGSEGVKSPDSVGNIPFVGWA
jgi:hypothetical protein